MDNPAARLFSARIAHWTSQGSYGSDLYQRLAEDPELPATFDTDEIAAIQGITPEAAKKQRHRGAGPAYIRLPKAVRYPRPDFCQYLARRYVRRAA